MTTVRTSKAGMVECAGKKIYFRAGVTLSVHNECEEKFKEFSEGLDLLTERERKLLVKAGLNDPEEVLAHKDLTEVQGIGKSTAESIVEKLNGN